MRMIFATLALFAAVPAVAATFQAQPANAPAARVIAKNVSWLCGNAGCVASSAESRPAVVCAQLAKKVGRLAGFSSNGTAFDADQLARCNTRAR